MIDCDAGENHIVALLKTGDVYVLKGNELTAIEKMYVIDLLHLTLLIFPLLLFHLLEFFSKKITTVRQTRIILTIDYHFSYFKDLIIVILINPYI